MKTKILFLFLYSSLIANSQSFNSVLKEGKWYKFSIEKNGVYKINTDFLKKLGVNVAKINPKNIKIYGNGGGMLPELASEFRYKNLQENAIEVVGENDNKFDNSDYILFYGKGSHQWKNYRNDFNHIQNIYDNKAYYFLTIGETPGKRITKAKITNTPANKTLTTYTDYVFYENESVNLLALGRLWFGEDFNTINTKNISIPFENAVSEEPIQIKVTGVAQSILSSTLNVTLNNAPIGQINFSPISKSSTSGLARYGELNISTTASKNLNFKLSYNNNGNPAAKAYLDYIEVIGTKKLTGNGKQFNFRNLNTTNFNLVYDYQIDNTNEKDQIWDVSDHLSPLKITTQFEGSKTSFKIAGGAVKEFVYTNQNNYLTPTISKNAVIENQNLHGILNVDYLIITNNTLINQANRLAEYYNKNTNLKTRVIPLSKIYNEFSSGALDIVAIRDFIKHVYDNSSNKKLKYVCFFGDSSYDYKNRIEGNNNIVPTYHAEASFNLVSSYVTDDFFVMIDDKDGSMSSKSKIDIASGRIPVSTPNQAKGVVDKILSYYTNANFGSWKNNITLLADDIDQNADKTIQPELEELADSIKTNKPQFNISKIYADAFEQQSSSAGERYPQVKELISRNIEQGTLVFNYFGHGGEDGLASERLLDISQIQSLSNNKKLPLFVTVTCEFSRFDNPLRDTAGEKLFRNPNGGAVGMITTTRDIYISVGERFNKSLIRYVLDFENKNVSIAENLMLAKNQTNSSQRFFIYFFGDPAMKLSIPKPKIKILTINDKDISKTPDTLKALSKINIKGVITDVNDKLLTDFNGKIEVNIFDKSIDKQTLDNDNFGQIEVFDTQESKLFRGISSVNNGNFNFEFIVPKDIKIAYGKGKISMYANNGVIEKNGANIDVIIGGINKNAPLDVTGPKINAYLDTASFVNGDTTTASPNLIIELEDTSGINTSLSAVDHDIVAILDNNDAKPIILNDFYETELNNYQKGKITYRLKNLSTGNHTLKIKAWDTYNNLSQTTLSFRVVDNTTLQLSNVLNYPNPFVNYTEFWFKHNKPNTPLDVQVQIFTISGKLIKTIYKQIETNQTLSRAIHWNGTDDFGNKIAKGVYVYKLKVTTNTNLTTEKYEKLVKL